ncbi:MAG: CcmF/CcyK/CcsA family cytochrome C bioproteinis [Geobacteraceae bacterium]|nr:MAG: CcmF/CcyK/CcsA family cytochrome C bioproteinis [Geobacteraceae bacterium]
MNGQFALVTGLHWGAVACYVVATLCAVTGVIFKSEKSERYGLIIAIPGLLLHGIALLIWWRIVGHGPYMDRFEVLSSNAWVMLALFLPAIRFYPRLRSAAVVVFPATFFLVALGLFLRPEIKNLPASYRGYWLILHIVFYKISFAATLIAVTFSIFYLLATGKSPRRLSFLPEPDVMDLYAYRFASFGFIFWVIGMLAGSIWAYQSLNMFWSWEPVQIWSLVTWVLFGLYLHMRRFYGWAGRKAAWLYILCFALAVFSLFVTPFINSSIHSEYFK